MARTAKSTKSTTKSTKKSKTTTKVETETPTKKTFKATTESKKTNKPVDKSNIKAKSTSDRAIVDKLFSKSPGLVISKKCEFFVGHNRVKHFTASALINHCNNKLFERIFYDTKKDDQITKIHIDYMEPDPFLYCLKYIYGGAIILNNNEIVSTCLLANQYSISDLPTKLIALAYEKINIYNCALIYDQFLKLPADLIKEEYLNKLIKIICLNGDLVFKSRLFFKIGKETLMKLLENDSLFIQEKDVYYGVIDWIEAELIRQTRMTSVKNQLTLFKDLKPLIRFPLLTKGQFEQGPAKSGLFTQEELAEFENFYQTKDIKQLSVNYKTNRRDDGLIYMLQFDSDDQQYKQIDRYGEDQVNDCESEIEEAKAIDFVEREEKMKKVFGKSYFKDGKRKRKFAGKDDDKKLEVIHVFKFRVALSEKYWTDDLVLEIHENNKKMNLSFVKFRKSDSYYFSLQQPVVLSNAKEYRICFRTLSNKCWSTNVKLENVTSISEDESALDVKMSVQKGDAEVAKLIDIFFFYDEFYEHPDDSVKEESLKENDSPASKSTKQKKPAKKKKKVAIISDDSDFFDDDY